MWQFDINWIVMWKLHRYHFFWIYLATGVPLRIVTLPKILQQPKGTRAITSGVLASLTSSVSSTWFPLVPILCLAPAYMLGAHWVADFLFISVPLVAATMALQTSFLDALLFRVLLKESTNRSFLRLLVPNALNSSIALILVFAWAYLYGPEVIA